MRVRWRGRLWLCRCVRITTQTPTADGLGSVVTALASWQRDEEIVAIGLVDRGVPSDEVAVIRMALAPSVDQDEDVARVLVRDLVDASAGVLPAGSASIEARFGQAFRSLLDARGWLPDEPWTPLHRDLAHAVEGCELRVETVEPSHVEEWAAVQRAAFAGSTFSVDRWLTMTAGIPYQQARCLVGYDDEGVAVAAVTVWSAGPARPGLLEPMGVHRDHRGGGNGTAITLAAAATLREMGSSSAIVATPTSNEGAVATYVAAGFVAAPDVADLRRPA